MDPRTKAAILAHNRQVPRYTSYPTAPHFKADVTAATYDQWLQAVPGGKALSLYFHIPFCRTLCWYCGCHTRATARYAPVQAYLERLKLEIQQTAARLGRRQPVCHIHFGGGSPSTLLPEDFTSLMLLVRERFDIAPGAEIAVELDPREITEAKVAAYAQAGVNRVSLGVQDFHEDVQVAINRRQPFHKIYDAVKLLQGYGIKAINMDLLYGLPHQTVDKVCDNVSFALALQPGRISLFGYAHVPWMKKHMRLIDEAALPDPAARLDQFDAAADLLVRRGMIPVGLDHFVDPTDSMARVRAYGQLHRNFQGYTTDPADALIGFGVSAISALPEGYAQNTSDSRAYAAAVDAGHSATVRGRALTPDDRHRRDLIERLMCDFEIDLAAFLAERRLPADYFAASSEDLQHLADEGLVLIQGSHIQVPDDARQAVRLVAACFDAYLVPVAGRHAQIA